MKRIMILSTLLSLWHGGYAQQPTEMPDSLDAGVLNEVVVEAQMQNTTARMSAYIPGAREKNAAKDAASLLNLMAIPQLSVDPVTDAVETLSGQPVSIFIDYVEASSEDISGLNPRDVKKVEYYDNTSDPRFSGKRYVINFIMQKYEWGGYTKMDAAQSFRVTKTDASVYSKMKYKSMSYDIYAGERYNAIRNAGDESVEDMRFPNLLGNGPANVIRSNFSKPENSHTNTNDISFRAIYDSDKIQLNNRIGFSYASSPETETTNNLLYGNDWSGSETTRSISSRSDMSARYRGQHLFMLPENLTLNIGMSFEYGNNKVNSLYCGSEGTSITNNAYEKYYSGTVNPNLYWSIDDCHTIRAYSVGAWRDSKIDYQGNSSSRQSYKIDGYQAGASYDFAIDCWSTHLNLGWTWQKNSISNYKFNTSYPRINAEVTYSPTQNSQLLASYEYYETMPTASSTGPVVLQQDELMYYSGNPKLKNSPSHEVGLQAVWLPSNKWQLAFSGFHYDITDRRVSDYLPEGPDGKMLRFYTNNGNYMSTMIGINATAKLLGGKLTARINPQLWLRRTTGVFVMTRNELTCTAQLTYFFGNFYATGWYMTPSHYPDENSGIESKTSSQYQLQLGWGSGAWNLRVSASNFLRSDWRANREILRSEYYDMSRRVYSPSQHMGFALTATYTFGYGKRVERDNELKHESSASSSSSSAILK